MAKLQLLAAVLLLGSTWLTAQDKELVLWHSYRGEEKKAIEQVVEAFNKKAAGDGYRVKPLAIPYDAYADKVTAAVPRGKGADVFIFAQDRLGGWIEAGNTVESLDFYLEDEIRGRFLPGMMDAMTYRDVVYGLPFNFKCILMIYNKALVSSPPKTTKELIEVAKKHSNPAAGKYGLAYAYSDFFYHAALMNGFGGRVFDPGPTPVLDDDKNLAALDLMMRWYTKDEILPDEPSTALITSLFNKGDAAIVFNGPWFFGEIDESVDYGLALLPNISEAGDQPMKPWLTVEGIYIAQPSEHKDEAYEFVKYLTSLDAAKVMATTGRQTPANKAVYDIPEVGNDPALNMVREQAALGIPMPNVPEMTMVWSHATTAMNKTVKQSSSAQAAMAEAQKKLQEDIARLRKGK
jgi:arabinogalactan oligomer/maltooligosaccharide transport system substrate-binding protein